MGKRSGYRLDGGERSKVKAIYYFFLGGGERERERECMVYSHSCTPAELQSKVDTKLGELFNSQEVVFPTSVLV